MDSNELSYKILTEYSSDIQIRQKRSSNDRLSTSPRQHDGPSQQQRQLRHREVEINMFLELLALALYEAIQASKRHLTFN